MPRRKTAILNLRIDPAIKEAIRIAAMREHRSIANMIEMLIRRHSAEAGIAIPDDNPLKEEESHG